MPEMVFCGLLVPSLSSPKWGEQKGTHRGGGAANPRAENAGAGGKDVDKRAVVGEAGLGITASGGADGANRGLRGGRVVGSVLVVVAGGDGEEDAGVDQGLGSRVGRAGEGTAQRHVGDGAVGAAARLDVVDDKVHAGDDTGAGTVSIVFLGGKGEPYLEPEPWALRTLTA